MENVSKTQSNWVIAEKNTTFNLAIDQRITPAKITLK